MAPGSTACLLINACCCLLSLFCCLPALQDGSQPAGSTSLTLVFDSGAQLEQVSRDNLYDIYNSEGLNNTFDQRSAYKGERGRHQNAPATCTQCSHCTVTESLQYCGPAEAMLTKLLVSFWVVVFS